MVVPPRRLGPKHYVWVVGAVLVIVAALHWLGAILTPFLIGAMLAYVGTPAVTWLQKRRVPRTIAVLLVMLVAFVLVLALILVLIPLIHSEFSQLAKRLPALAAGLYAQVAPWLDDKLGIQLQFDLDTVKQLVSENLNSAQAVSLKVLTGLKAGGLLVISLLINLILIPVVMFYLLRDWPVLVTRLDELTPRRWLGKVRTLAREIDNVLGEFIRGQLSVMAVLATYYAVGLTIAGLQFALPIGILTGLLVFIPYVGFGLGLVLGHPRRGVAVARPARIRRGARGLRRRPDTGRLRADPVAGRRSHRLASAGGDLRACSRSGNCSASPASCSHCR